MIRDLFFPGNVSIGSTLVLYSFVIALGIYLGKIKLFGVSLGVTFVLFVGIVMGHFGYIVDAEILKFVREFGLILFIFSIGLQVGPGFFSSFKKGGVTLNVLAVGAIVLNVAIVLCVYFFGNVKNISALVGVMSGAVTNTPGLAAAQQAIITQNDSALKPDMISIEVTNPLIDGRTLLQLHDVITCNFVVSRLMRPDGEIIIPRSTTEIHIGDKLFIVFSAHDIDRFRAVLGNQIEMDWEATPTPVYSRRILVTIQRRVAWLAAPPQRIQAQRYPRQPCWRRPPGLPWPEAANGRPYSSGRQP